MKKSTSKTASNMKKLSTDSYCEAYGKLEASLEEAKKKEAESSILLQNSMDRYFKVR
ncbi:hypothetical protein [Flagellimonas lutimaris]|uniref:hypothetical protein n=1 Tax=Flagellimonas lutimaris TaxID=475082 RepID=UPI003F5CE45A